MGRASLSKVKPNISREAARSIVAARVDHDCVICGTVKVGRVLSYEEIDISVPRIYNFPAERLQHFWVAYVEHANRGVLASSLVLLVSKETGEIVYIGSANDGG